MSMVTLMLLLRMTMVQTMVCTSSLPRMRPVTRWAAMTTRLMPQQMMQPDPRSCPRQRLSTLKTPHPQTISCRSVPSDSSRNTCQITHCMTMSLPEYEYGDIEAAAEDEDGSDYGCTSSLPRM